MSASSPFLCSQCQAYLSGSKIAITKNDDNKSEQAETEKNDSILCSCCMGLWSEPSKPPPALVQAIGQACEPYGGIQANRFARQTDHRPTISIAADIHVRYKYFASKNNTACPVTIFVQELKQHLQRTVHNITTTQGSSSQAPLLQPLHENAKEQRHYEEEEQGYLSMHVLCIPPKDMSIMKESTNNKKRKRRQRFRPFQTQGGDPRVNLELRLQAQGYEWIPLSSFQDDNSNNINQDFIKQNTTAAMEFHIAVFRRPIFLYGYYTKSRRDVSQTPFVVSKPTDKNKKTKNGDSDMKEQEGKTEPDNEDNESPMQPDNDSGAATTTEKDVANDNDKMSTKTTTTLGVTSVEEQICNPIVKLLGISTQNNNDTSTGGNVIYGCCKFHASGREDMDVRMLLRPNTKGRPFCVQLIDALRPLETMEQLTQLVDTINYTSTTTNSEKEDECSSHLWYGRNPLGVGISNDFRLVPARAFSNLQADTETKIKHYGCHCWSERPLPPPSTTSLNEIFFQNVQFPLTIQQKTPLRVLHRRANLIRERQILDANAIRVDDHHFRLELTTQAGTYVKEFVHGDLRRTTPNMGSILQCKTNILLLDCEGIDMEEHIIATNGIQEEQEEQA